MGRLGVTVLVLILLAATAAAFGIAERLKLQRSPVTAPRFDRLVSPTCGCRTGVASLSLTLRTADTVAVAIVDSRGAPVRSLVTASRRPRGVATFKWDGRDDAGEAVADGLYRLRIELAREGRTIVIPTPIRVDGTPPGIELVGSRPSVMSPDGDGRRDRVIFAYRASESSYPLVFVSGVAAVRGRYRPAGPDRISWRGRLRGRFVPAGSYRASLRAVDRAGNVSEPTRAVSIRVRYVELAGGPFRAPPGGTFSFRVETDAKSFRWELGRRGMRRGSARAGGRAAGNRVRVRVPRLLQPGRYVLRVFANGRSDRAPVLVTAPR